MSIVLIGSTSGSITLQEPAVAGTTVLTLPATTGNVVVDSATQTLTNKTIEGGTVISGTAVASTSGTSIDFTSIPSWVKRITVMFDVVSTNGSSDMQIQIGSGSVTTSGYVGATVFITSGSASGTNFSAGFLVSNSLGSGNTYSGIATLCLLSSNKWTFSIVTGRGDAATIYSGGGVSSALSGALDRVRITTANGTDTFDAGSINILYE